MRKIILVISVVLLASIYNIVEASAPEFPAAMIVNSKRLILNGIGMRYATFLKIKVYRAALYLDSKESSAEMILASTSTKRLDMIFLREVPKEKLQDGWRDGFENNKVDTKNLAKEIAQLLAAMQPMKKRHRMSFIFAKDGVNILFDNVLKTTIKSSVFSQKLLLLWLGIPPNDELKLGLLGSSES